MPQEHILFVEDTPGISLINSVFLREYGYRVTEASCAADALDQINRREPLTALVTDINLGLGQDGFDVARHARAVYPHLPVIFISALNKERHRFEGVRGSEFIAKPFYPRQIVDALIRTLYQEQTNPIFADPRLTGAGEPSKGQDPRLSA